MTQRDGEGSLEIRKYLRGKYSDRVTEKVNEIFPSQIIEYLSNVLSMQC